MRLGLITDIHEDLEQLVPALEHLKREAVDQIVLIGDVFEIGHRVTETTRILQEFEVIGVWGNHDLGLCLNPDPDRITRYSLQTIEYMGTLQPRLQLAGCHFSHVYPWLNPYDVADMWYFHGTADPHAEENLEDVRRCFTDTDHGVMFLGHFHCWSMFREGQPLPWRGERSIILDRDQRYLIFVDAIAQRGSHAIYDTETRELIPYHPASTFS